MKTMLASERPDVIVRHREGVCRLSAWVTAAILVCMLLQVLQACGEYSNDPVEWRGSVTTFDGVVLAESRQSGDGYVREYPQGSLACQLVGSRYASGVSNGIEDQMAAALEAGQSLQLTLDSGVQKAAERVLKRRTGAIVVMDPDTGAILAMASSPICDLNDVPASTDEALRNRAVELHITGSTFKTITLAAALESGAASIDTPFDAPSELRRAEGSVTNYESESYEGIPLHSAYAHSCNTVFVQLSLQLGVPSLERMAYLFGFGHRISQDIDCAVSEISNPEAMNDLARAWCGAGQAIYANGEAYGPFTTALNMAAATSVVANGGRTMAPYVVATVTNSDGAVVETGSPMVLEEGFISNDHLDQISDAMLEAVREGTATRAAVPDIDVRGKTGTAETLSGKDDGWFCGFASSGDAHVTVVVLLEDAASAEACTMASAVIDESLVILGWGK